MTTFSYNRDIPESGNDPSVDQPDLKINTNSIDDLINVDHVSFGLPNGGLHRQVTLLNKTSALDPTGQLAAFTHQGNTWPAWTNSLGTTLMLGSNTLALPTGYVSLPGGLLLQWGTTGNIASGTPVLFPIAFPTAVFDVIANQRNSGSAAAQRAVSTSATPPTTTQFVPRITTLGSSPSDSSAFLFWIAIGN